ncbi:MAG: LacI family DNA-binding transcriptional regulator [Chloroflexota bacterium]
MARHQVTIRDVAALAGVSHQTVSRVINNRDGVTLNTRMQVETAIKELGYRPNAIARSMAKGHTHTLGCISPNLTNYIFSSMIESAQAEARRQGFFILTGSAPTADDVPPLLDEMLNRRVDGLLVLNPHDDDRYRHLLPLIQGGLPVVYLKNSPKGERVSSVCFDDQNGSYQAARYLMELGHTAIATITGPENEECSQDRLDGYRQLLLEKGINLDPALIVKGDWSAESGGKAVQKLLSSEIPFSSVFAHNDQMAVGAIRALRNVGMHVPGDISVIGYDDIPLASYFDPPLTTIRQPMNKFGRHGAQLLIDAVQNPEHELKQVRLDAQIIKRDSCAPPRQ